MAETETRTKTEFAQKLEALGCKPKMLQVMFPGIPVPTAYDWCSGARGPRPYLEKVLLAYIKQQMKKKAGGDSR